MVSKSTREAARRIIIAQGGGYYARLLTENGVKTFSELPDDVLKRIAKGGNHGAVD